MPFVDVGNGFEEHRPMDGAKLMDARRTFGMTRLEFAHILGMSGNNRNIYMTIKRYEEGARPISPMLERLVTLLLWYKSDFGCLPDLDRGERTRLAEAAQ